MYGLLNKRDDLLIFECINTTKIIVDPENQIMLEKLGTKKIGMQFDFRSKYHYITNLGI